MPLWPQGDNLLVKFSGDAAGHGDDHCLAVESFLSLLVMADDILCHMFDAVFTSHQGLELGPLRLFFL